MRGRCEGNRRAHRRQLRPDLVRVLTDRRGSHAIGGRRPRQLQWVGHRVDVDALAVRDGRDGLEADLASQRERLVNLIDHSAGDAGGAETRDPRGGRRTAERVVDRRKQRVTVLDPSAVRDEPFVVGERRQAEDLAERPELAVVADRRSRTGRRRPAASRRARSRVTVAHPAADDPRRQPVGCLVGQREQRRGQQIDLDQLALAGAVAMPQRREDPDRRHASPPSRRRARPPPCAARRRRRR